MNLTEEQFSEWEDLKRRYRTLRKLWWANINNNKQRLNTVKREDALVSLVRRFQGFGELLDTRRTERRRQAEAQNADASDQKLEEIAQAQRNILQLQVQARNILYSCSLFRRETFYSCRFRSVRQNGRRFGTKKRNQG